MTWLDRAIGWVAPGAGLRRAQHRLAMEAVLHYEGARKDRSTENWFRPSTDADAASQGVLGTLRDSAHDLVRNNPYAASAVDVKVTETIGTGIVPEIPNRMLRNAWDAWTENCDYDGEEDFNGLQAAIERARFESGEVLIVRRPVARTTDEIRAGLPPFALRVLEPDYLDHSKDGKRDDGTFVRYGIARADAMGGPPVGYWLYDDHPGAGQIVGGIKASGLRSQFYAAKDVIHLYRRLRPGQTRGVTDFAPVILRTRNLDDYDEAEIMRLKIEACLAAFVTQPQGVTGSPIAPVKNDEQGRIETLYPGMIEYLKHGEDVRMATPHQGGMNADFRRASVRAIGVGVGIPYELLAGDLSDVNYSSYRAGLVRFRRRLEQDQWLMYVPRFCNRVYGWFREELGGMRGSQNLGARTAVKWTPPRFELIDPLKETQAELEAVLAGFDTWEEVVRRRGWTAMEQLDVLEQWQQELDRRGIKIKSDFRNTMSGAGGGSAPPSGGGGTPPNDDDEGDEPEQEAA